MNTATVAIINLIPTPDGKLHNLNHRNALGYPWQSLKERIPGDDRPVKDNPAAIARGYNNIYEEMRHRYGEITVTECDGYMNQTVDGNKIEIDRQYLVAVVTGMWSGSVARYIYRGTHSPRPRIVVDSPVLVDDGSWAIDPEPAHGANGYCRICHGYCYSDCEANGLHYSGR